VRAVEASIELAASPDAAIDAFLRPEDLRGFWGVERAFVEPRVGGTYVVAWGVGDAGFKYVSTGVVAVYEPGRRLELSNYTYLNPERPIFAPMTLTVEARAVAGGAHVTVRQGGYRDGADWDWYHDAVTQAWPVVLGQLKAHLERA
jgi:hypothetical protein